MNICRPTFLLVTSDKISSPYRAPSFENRRELEVQKSIINPSTRLIGFYITCRMFRLWFCSRSSASHCCPRQHFLESWWNGACRSRKSRRTFVSTRTSRGKSSSIQQPCSEYRALTLYFSNLELVFFSSLTQVTDEKPLVVILSWLQSKQKHLSKYAELYMDQGFDVAVMQISPWQLLWPVKGSQVSNDTL